MIKVITEPGIVYYDSRENPVRIALLKEYMKKDKCLHTLQKVNNFVTADVAYGSCAIELKRMYDFIGSIKGGKIFEQVKKMKRAGFDEVHLVISRELDGLGDLRGIDDYGGMHVNSIVAAISTLASKKYRCTVVILDNEEQAMYHVWKLIQKHDYLEVVLDRATIVPTMSVKDVKKAMLMSVEGLGKTKVHALLKAFNHSVDEIATASSEEIMRRVKGIGITIANRIKDALA